MIDDFECFKEILKDIFPLMSGREVKLVEIFKIFCA